MRASLHLCKVMSERNSEVVAGDLEEIIVGFSKAATETKQKVQNSTRQEGRERGVCVLCCQ